jgi:hypothetical protein
VGGLLSSKKEDNYGFGNLVALEKTIGPKEKHEKEEDKIAFYNFMKKRALSVGNNGSKSRPPKCSIDQTQFTTKIPDNESQNKLNLFRSQKIKSKHQPLQENQGESPSKKTTNNSRKLRKTSETNIHRSLAGKLDSSQKAFIESNLLITRADLSTFCDLKNKTQLPEPNPTQSHSKKYKMMFLGAPKQSNPFPSKRLAKNAQAARSEVPKWGNFMESEDLTDTSSLLLPHSCIKNDNLVKESKQSKGVGDQSFDRQNEYFGSDLGKGSGVSG